MTGTARQGAAPLVSVVIPTWNRAALLREAIASVQRQTFGDWELIVADDGSTDETRASLDAIDDTRLRVLWLPHSGNEAVPRNAALGAARGEWIAFLDSDDLWHPEKLGRQLDAMSRHPSCGWSYTGYALVDEHGAPLASPRTMHHAKSGWILPALLDFTATPCQPATMVHRALLERLGGFDESFPLRADYDLLLRLAAASEVVAIPETLAFVRQHPGRTTSQWGHAELHRLNVRVFRKAADAADSASIRALCRRQCARQLTEMAVAHSRAGEHRAAFAALGRAMCDAPTLPALWRATAGCALRGARRR